MALLEEMCHYGVDFKVSKLQTKPSLSFFSAAMLPVMMAMGLPYETVYKQAPRMFYFISCLGHGIFP